MKDIKESNRSFHIALSRAARALVVMSLSPFLTFVGFASSERAQDTKPQRVKVEYDEQNG